MRFHYTLKKALSLNFILAAIAPLVVIGFVMLHMFTQTIEQEISSRNIQVAEAFAGDVERILMQAQRLLALVNQRAVTRQKSGPTPSPDLFLQLMVGNLPVFERLEIVDPHGVIRHIAPKDSERLGTTIAGQPFFERARTSGQLVFSDVFVSSATGQPTIAAIAPGEKGFAVGYVSLAGLKKVIEKVHPHRSGYPVITDRLGRIIAHPDQHFVDERTSIKNIEPIRRALKAETGTFRYTFMEQEKIGSTALVKPTGWVVMVCVPVKSAFAPVGRIRNLVLAAVFVMAIIAVLLATAFLKKPLRSIASLVEAAGKISRGDYRFDGVPSSYAEIDTLAEGFTDMVAEIASRQNALMKTEERYRSLVEASFDGVMLHDGREILFANQSLHRMLGYAETEIVGREFTSLLHPDYRAQAIENTSLRFEGKVAPRRYDVKLITRDGSFLDTEVSAGVVRIENKPAIQVWVRDISEQKRLEAERNLSAKRLGELYDSVTDLIYTQDLEGRFLSANRAIADLFDLTPSEMVGLKASSFMKPELADKFNTEYLETLKKTGRHQGITAYHSDKKVKFYIEYHSVLVTPPQGEPYISGIGRDVTEQIMTRRRIREDAERMKVVLETSPTPTIVYDAEGKVVMLNRSFTDIFGWTLEELSGKFNPFVPDEERERTFQPIRDLYAGKISGAINLETVRLTRSGQRRDVHVSAALLRSSAGEATGMVVSLMDITERKKMEAALQQASKMEAIGTLAGGIAHDFNNLLMGIQGNVSLSLIRKELDASLRKNLESIEAMVTRGATLTRQLLGFARGGKYEVKTYDICDILEIESALFGNTHKEIVIERKPAPDLWKVDVDRAQIEQVFMNLFVNAGQAMPGGGNIYLSAENVVIDEANKGLYEVKPGRYVKISVTDTGVGMDEQTQKRVFEPFFTTKEPGKGTGMGLASVYGIVKNHGGFINLYSALGMGTTFNVYLPASGSVAVEKAVPLKTEVDILPGKGTILLVDDEPMILDVGQEMLESMGYRVIAAGSGKDAIDAFAASIEKTGEVAAIDLVIQDMIMPGIGGGEVFDRLRELDPNVKVILSSGYSLNGQAKEILARGCAGFIQKPFTMAELNRKVREVLSPLR